MDFSICRGCWNQPFIDIKGQLRFWCFKSYMWISKWGMSVPLTLSLFKGQLCNINTFFVNKNISVYIQYMYIFLNIGKIQVMYVPNCKHFRVGIEWAEIFKVTQFDVFLFFVHSAFSLKKFFFFNTLPMTTPRPFIRPALRISPNYTQDKLILLIYCSLGIKSPILNIV